MFKGFISYLHTHIQCHVRWVGHIVQRSEMFMKISGSHSSEYEEDSLLGCKPCSLIEVDRHFRGFTASSP
jgi:hypothetical protein